VLTRRGLLAATATTGIAAATAPLALANPARKRALRIAHLTDIHVQPERRAGEGMQACLDHVEALKDKPDVIFTGGDQIMDAMGATFDRTKVQWDLHRKVLADNTGIPMRHCVGNHDVWGWAKKEGDPANTEALRGKAWTCEMLEIPKPYYSFDQAGWHFVVLDSTFPKGNGYTAKLDDEQFEWLGDDLTKSKGKPTLILSHIPIIAFCPFFDGDNEKSGDWQVPGAWMHIDARKIKDLFKQHPHVKVAISGHIHLVDRVDYCGVTYFCNGAVSGGWWNGAYQECNPGYALVDLYDDGSFENQYVEFGWKAQA